MKRLARFHDSGEADQLAELLRGKGIATFIRNIGVRSNHQWAVHVPLDSQADEAALVLADPDYEPAHRVDVDAIEAALPASNLGLIAWWVTVALVVMLAAMAGLVALLLD